MIDIGTQITIRPTYGDLDAETTGKVVEASAGSLVVRVGRFPWLKNGARLTCSAPVGGTHSRFLSFIQDSSDTNGFAIRIPKPVAVEDANRRSEPRLATPQSIVWSRVVDGQLVGYQERGTTIDISEGGLAFETTARPPMRGEMIAVSISLPIGELVVLGKVTGIDDTISAHFADRHAVRMSRLATPPEQQDEFQRWLKSQLIRTPVGVR